MKSTTRSSHQSPITHHQSPIPITNPNHQSQSQSPITNHQSPITNQQSPITDHQSPITNQQSPIKYTHYCIGRNHSPPTCRYSYSYLCLFDCHHYRLSQPCRTEMSPTNHYVTLPNSKLNIASLANIIVETKEEPHKSRA